MATLDLLRRRCLKPWLLQLSLVVILGCSRHVESQPGICLSFDDRNLEQWVDILPLLKENDAKVTFFLNGVETLNSAEKSMINQIRDEGHDIQAHGEHHFSMNSYISGEGLFSYLKEEIDGHLECFEALGISPTVFAYPFGEKNHYIDLFLWRKFSATRNVASKRGDLDQMDEIFYRISEARFHFFSLAIDDSEAVSDAQLAMAVRRAQQNDEVLLVHAHEIGEERNLGISRNRLKWLLETGRKSGLKHYTYAELSK
jgi:peptidoglycan/xylan/chitin deacetylase (PgdA/CDA1 family)